MPCQRCGEPAVGSEGVCRACGALATGAGRYRPPTAPGSPPYSAQSPVPGYGYGAEPAYGPPYAASGGRAASDERRRSVKGVGAALKFFLGVTVLCLVGFAADNGWRYSAVSSVLDGTGAPPSASAADLGSKVFLGSAIGAIGGLAVSGVLTIVWFYAARSNAGTYFGSVSFTLGRGWAIGGWFVPIASLVLPLLVARDVFKGTTGRPANGLVGVWWVLWLGWTAAVSIPLRGLGVDDPGDAAAHDRFLQRTDAALVPGPLVLAAAGVALFVIVARVTAIQTARNARAASGW